MQSLKHIYHYFLFSWWEQNLYIERIDSNVNIFAFMVSGMYVVSILPLV